ncbi:MAG: hypothetical protein GWN59_05815, partial [Calditrichae bacterium]|nr:hypothetical protein [Calditrichia bacterium]
VAFTRENNLYILKNDSQEIAITEEKNSDIVSGQEVHRREFGISEGTFWSPQNHYLAFYRKDESLVTDYP